MIYKSLHLIQIIKIILIVVLVVAINMSNIEIYGRMFNQFKNHELTNIFGEKKRSLILLTVTGDKRYKNKEIEEEYKNLQIIHVLVI